MTTSFHSHNERKKEAGRCCS